MEYEGNSGGVGVAYHPVDVHRHKVVLDHELKELRRRRGGCDGDAHFAGETHGFGVVDQ